MSRSRKLSKEEAFINELEHSLYMINYYKIQVIKDYLKDFDKYLKERTDEIQDKIIDWEKSPKESNYSAIDYYIEDYTNYNSNFKELKLESVFLSSYSLFEHFFKTFALSYKNYYNLKLDIDDLSGNNYINKTKLYLEKVIVLDLSSLNSLWNKITKYQKIRNKIVHSNSRFNKSDKETIKELNKMDGIEINTYGLITMTDKKFILNFWNLFDEYINEIIEITKLKINHS
ncbi:hypothetical protein [Flavobacterium sp. UBA7663]|uniref:hypothetical protein n=1 Tax=Flavobacterium sp. UBA7663 TaxID=1946557 RepID=UPI0025C25C84|nr:hypothetical protein [Flavobacterium sp. UBA7663]